MFVPITRMDKSIVHVNPNSVATIEATKYIMPSGVEVDCTYIVAGGVTIRTPLSESEVLNILEEEMNKEEV